MLRYKLCLVVVVVCCVSTTHTKIGVADETPSPSQAIYHADPDHLWNRLHEALFVRGRFGHDRLEPLLWAESKHLLEERSHKRVMAVLEELLKNNGEKLIDDPLKRAVFQRDLWLVFNWLESRYNSKDFGDARERLRGPLAELIRRLALSPQEIRDLPDNYATAIASGQFAKSFDIEKRNQPYLPPDLFAADGPWVSVGRTDTRTAPTHSREGNPFANSVFLVFVRLPVGNADRGEIGREARSAVADYLSSKVKNDNRPAFPTGTELALVRRAMLIDTSNRVVPSNLTESVQLRVIRESRRNDVPFEFRMSRSQLFASRAGGLRASGKDDRDFTTGYGSRMRDEFEDGASRGMLPSERMQPVLRCSGCHDSGFVEFRSGDGRFPEWRWGSSLAEMSVSDVAASAIQWRVTQGNWIALKQLLEKPSPHAGAE